MSNEDLVNAERIAALVTNRRTSHDKLLAELENEASVRSLSQIATLVAETLENGGTILFFGNGGSCADAQHATAELVGRFGAERRPLAAIALGTNPAVSSALGNDYGFADEGLARELEAVGKPGDLAFGLTTSGRSANILAALARARDVGMKTVALTGPSHELEPLVDHLLVVNSSSTPLIQEVHIVIYHLICEIVESILDLT